MPPLCRCKEMRCIMKKRSLMIVLCLCAGLLSACTQAGKKEDVSTESSSGETFGEQELMEQNTEDIRDFALKQGDADQLVSEKLSGTGYDFEADGVKEFDGNHYYIYRVSRGDAKLAQGLAVDDISGEVFTYEPDSESLSDYGEFELYDAEKDAQARWDGNYYMEENMISLLPADNKSSEIQVIADGEEIFTGVIYHDGNTAVVEGADFTAELTLDADELTVQDKKGKSGFSGNYVLE